MILRYIKIYQLIILFFVSNFALSDTTSVEFAVIGDYGKTGSNELAVSVLVKSWTPDFIITTGDNNYDLGEESTIDENIGQYYSEFIYPYVGSYGTGDTINRFFPSLGNHDWYTTGALPYLNYFTLPGNERYYDFIKGSVHFFVIDSYEEEPDGMDSSSVQAQWLRNALATSTSTWKIVYFHYPPYSSGEHGSYTIMQWPFKEWGASVVIAGHDHIYERLSINDFPYFVNGLGGKSIYSIGTLVEGSQITYNDNYGAMLVEANSDSIIFKFINIVGDTIDNFKMTNTLTNIFTENNIQYSKNFLLEQNYPNPFNPLTSITFQIPKAELVSLKIYDITGKLISELVNGILKSGNHIVKFDGTNLPSGIYFYKLTTRNNSEIKKMVFVK